MAIVVSFLLMASLPFDTWIRFVLWLAIGMAIYFMYSRHHSRVQRGVIDVSEPPRGDTYTSVR